MCSSAASPVWCIGVLGLSVHSHPRSLHLTLCRVGIDIIYTDSRVGTRLTPQAVVWVIGRRSALSRCASESITLWKVTSIDTTYTFVHCCIQYTQTYITHTPLLVKANPLVKSKFTWLRFTYTHKHPLSFLLCIDEVRARSACSILYTGIVYIYSISRYSSLSITSYRETSWLIASRTRADALGDQSEDEAQRQVHLHQGESELLHRYDTSPRSSDIHCKFKGTGSTVIFKSILESIH